MNHEKRILVALLCSVLCTSLVACGEQETKPSPQENSSIVNSENELENAKKDFADISSELEQAQNNLNTAISDAQQTLDTVTSSDVTDASLLTNLQSVLDQTKQLETFSLPEIAETSDEIQTQVTIIQDQCEILTKSCDDLKSTVQKVSASKVETVFSEEDQKLLESITAETASRKGEGSDGTQWYYKDGTLIIKGSGKLTSSFSDLGPSWREIPNINKIIIDHGITEIQDRVFSASKSLREITIPRGVTSIGDYAFYNCTSLSQITLPDTLTSIGENVFNNCESLTEIVIPDSVTYIGSSAFLYCYGLKKAVLPQHLKELNEEVFKGCWSLTEIVIPDEVTSIGEGAFSSCRSLTEITIPNGIIKIENQTFYECYSLEKITIPQNLTSIGHSALSGCKSLQEIIIPPTVTFIGKQLFRLANLSKRSPFRMELTLFIMEHFTIVILWGKL